MRSTDELGARRQRFARSEVAREPTSLILAATSADCVPAAQ
jgi:hypothetical protein